MKTDSSEIYKEHILDSYKNPQNRGEFQTEFAYKGINTYCGDEINLFLKIENGKIKEAKFSGTGCVISMVAADFLAEKLKGRTLKEANAVDEKFILKLLNIPISEERINCATLALKSLKEIMKNA